MSKTIAIVGAGQLGSRHLQALARLRGDYRVEVVDVVPESLDRAAQRYAEVEAPGSPPVGYSTELCSLPAELDVVVVATTADVRRRVIESLIDHARVKYLVLEKVLFQNRDDYPAVLQMLAQRQVKVWVNCVRRMWTVYQELRYKLDGDRQLLLEVCGSAWGLGSNTVHFLDLFAFLSGSNELELPAGALSVKLLASKRPGFAELAGHLVGRSPGGYLSLTSFESGTVPLVVQVVSRRLRALVHESEGFVAIAEEASEWRWSEQKFEVPYVSSLTHLVVEQLMARGDCELTPVERSAQHHLAFLAPLTATLNEDRCPIT